MAVKLKNGAEFLHIPKTGGRWVSSILKKHDLILQNKGHKHADYDLNMFDFDENLIPLGKGRMRTLFFLLSTIKRKVLVKDEKDSKPFRFCFVRHPLSWYESWWKYMQTIGWRDFGVQNSATLWHPNATLNGLGSSDFNEFIWNVIKKRPGYVSELFLSYSKPGINFIGRTETLNRDLLEVLGILNVEIEKSEILNSPKFHESKRATIEWDPKLREMLLKLELPALVHFGYLNKKEQFDLGFKDFVPPHSALYL